MKIEIFDDRRCTLGEGPTSSGDSNSRIMWVDIIGKRILSKDILTGQVTEKSTNEEVGFALPGEGSGVVVGYASGAKFITDNGGEFDLPSWREITPDSEETPVRWNDAKVSPHRQLFAGTMAFDATPGAGGLYRIDSKGREIQELIPQVSISNGLDWSPKKDKFYYIDTLKYSVVEYDYSEKGISNPRILISFDNGDVLPDGMCVDAEGGIWVAFWNGGRINRYEPNGNLSGSYPLPVKNVTSCAFGGPNLDTLIITTAALTDEDNPDSGKTFMANPGVKGQPFNLFPIPST
jgi:sugar lactone lactonase YvrE